MSKNKVRSVLSLAAVAAALALCQTAWAESVELSLQEAMERAFATNPAITMATYARNSARASYNAARESYGISISAEHQTQRGGYNDDHYVSNWAYDPTSGGMKLVPQNVGKQIANSHANGISASLPIYTGGQLEGATQSARANYKYYEQGLQQSYNQLRGDVVNGYYGLLQAADSQKLCQDSVTRLAEHLKNVQAQYDVGVVAKVDVLRSQVEVANAQQNLIKAENARAIAEANLNRIVGLPMSTELKLVDSMQYVSYDNDLQYCLDYATEHRPELEMARQNVNAAKGSLRSAISGHMPKFYASASQSWSDSNWPGDENGNWGIGISATITIFDSGVTSSRIHGAEADLDRAKEALRDTQDAVNLDVRTNYLNMREAEKRISTTEVAVEQAQEDYHIAQVRYMAGVGTNTDVLDAQVALVDAQNNYLTAKYDYQTSKTNLETAIGVPMTVPVKVEASPYQGTVNAEGEEIKVKEEQGEVQPAAGEAPAAEAKTEEAGASQAQEGAPAAEASGETGQPQTEEPAPAPAATAPAAE